MENSIKSLIGRSKNLKKLCHKIQTQENIEPAILAAINPKARPFCRLVNINGHTVILSCSKSSFLTELYYSQNEIIQTINRISSIQQTITKVIWRPYY